MARSHTSGPSPARGDARNALLGAAHTLVRKQGWSATSVDQLCKSAGVTKGAFFHHFPTKEDLGIAAAKHWHTVTSPLFINAPYNALADPLDRIFGYIDFRAAIADGPLEDFTCFVGTTVQETFASSEAIRAACGETMAAHTERVATDFRAAIAQHAPRSPVTAESLARYTQVVLQGGFVLSKAAGDRTPLLDALGHLKSYLALLFRTTTTEDQHHGDTSGQLHLVRADDPRSERGGKVLRRSRGLDDSGSGGPARRRRPGLPHDRKK